MTVEANQPISTVDALHQMGAWVAEVEKRFDDLRRIALQADEGSQWVGNFIAQLHAIKMAAAQSHLAIEQFVIASQALDVSLGELSRRLGSEVIQRMIPEQPCKLRRVEDEPAYGMN